MAENKALPFEIRLKVMQYLEKIEQLMKMVRKELEKAVSENKI